MRKRLLTGARYLKLGLLEGVVGVSRYVLREARMGIWETKKDLNILPPAADLAAQIIHDAGEEDYGCDCSFCN